MALTLHETRIEPAELDVRLLRPSAVCRAMSSGETLFSEGETPTALYQVHRGFMKLTWASPGGRETIIELLLPGDVFDLPSCLDGRPYPLTCKAPSNAPAAIWVVSRKALLDNAALGLRCQTRNNQQLREHRAHPVSMAGERVEARVGRALLWLAESLGKAEGSATSFPLLLTRQELAEWVGTTTETVIRICSDMSRRGLIAAKKGEVRLLDVPALRALSDIN